MSGGESWFITPSRSHRPDRMLLDMEPVTELERPVALQPSPFFVDFKVEPPPAELVEGAPILTSCFIARVEEIEKQEVSLRLWELTGGGEALATLDQAQLSEAALPGDLILLWIWFELPGAGQIRERVYGLVRKHGFSEADMPAWNKARALLELQDGVWP